MAEVARAHGRALQGWLSAAHVQRAAELGLGQISEAEYFECRLGADSHQIDYLVAVSRNRAPDALHQLRTLSEQQARSSSSCWLPLVDLFTAWASGRSAI